MKLGTKNLELFFIVALFMLTIVEFLLLSAGIMSQQLVGSLQIMSVLMVVGGEIIICIILLRIYARIDVNSAKKPSE